MGLQMGELPRGEDVQVGSCDSAVAAETADSACWVCSATSKIHSCPPPGAVNLRPHDVILHLRRRWAFAESRLMLKEFFGMWHLETAEVRRQRRVRQVRAVHEGRMCTQMRRLREVRTASACLHGWASNAAVQQKVRIARRTSACEAVIVRGKADFIACLAWLVWQAWVVGRKRWRGQRETLRCLRVDGDADFECALLRAWALVSKHTGSEKRNHLVARSSASFLNAVASHSPALVRRLLSLQRTELLRKCLSWWAGLAEEGFGSARIMFLQAAIDEQRCRHCPDIDHVVRLWEAVRQRRQLCVTFCLWIAYVAGEREMGARAELLAQRERWERRYWTIDDNTVDDTVQ